MNSGELIHKATSRNRDAFDRLVKQNEVSLKNYISKKLNRDVDDVFQESILAAWQNIESFQHKSSFSTWLTGIAQHKIYDRILQHTRLLKEQNISNLAELPQEEKIVPFFEELVSGLSEEKQSLLRRYYIEGWTLAEISSQSNLNLNTVKYQFYRALSELKSASLGEVLE